MYEHNEKIYTQENILKIRERKKRCYQKEGDKSNRKQDIQKYQREQHNGENLQYKRAIYVDKKIKKGREKSRKNGEKKTQRGLRGDKIPNKREQKTMYEENNGETEKS